MGVLDEAWEMFLGACGGECTWDCKKDCFFVFGEMGDSGGLEFVCGVKVGEGGVWKGVSQGDCGRDCRGG